jgi:acetyltransferase-like isoleucine patch superfamily enzyme
MKKHIALLISVLPGNALRVLFYRVLFGFRIRNSRVGFGTAIAVKSFDMQDAAIGRFCRFFGPMEVEIGEKSTIGHSNQFLCSEWTKNASAWSYQPRLLLGTHTLITSGHYFDVSATMELGDRSWIAGYASQFWTHGPDIGCKDIHIGSDCYIGSAATFCPGAAIGSRVLVGAGSVVTEKIGADDAIVAGVPATIKKARYDWRNKKHLS